MTSSEKYTAAAYLVVFLAVLVYVVIIGSKLQRLQREVEQLVELVKEKRQRADVEEKPAGVEVSRG
jgi:CcmD family protein